MHQARVIMGKLKLAVNEEKTRTCKVPADPRVRFDERGVETEP